jgi:hypothetical protein
MKISQVHVPFKAGQKEVTANFKTRDDMGSASYSVVTPVSSDVGADVAVIYAGVVGGTENSLNLLRLTVKLSNPATMGGTVKINVLSSVDYKPEPAS